MLEALFRKGVPPDPPLDGRTDGKLVALDIGPVITPAFRWLAARWVPWRGKTFDAERSGGDNIFTSDSRRVARLLTPGYRGYLDDGPDTYRAFAFRTYLAPGRTDTDQTVLKIDYDLPENPGPTVRRVLDELVQIGEGTYLGKAHMHWWWGRWQRVAFFSLTKTDGGP